MAKIKMKKKSTSTDMTAMCDVAFLLLTFFILTATAKVPEVMPVDTPASTVQTKLPDSDLATLTIGNVDGKDRVFFDLKGKDVRKKTLELMAEKYGMTFSEEDKDKFALMTDFGVPIGSLKQIIDMKSSDRVKADQTGIPMDSLDNQLKEWVYNARKANIEVNDKELQVAIKGDAKEQYPVIRKVMDLLQDQNVNTFSLITGLRGKDF
ncbi:outer membrane transport energization protein ExbD [Flavobacterium flevense]|uniref:Biopolymer transporter ExbD n=1 Tax=Flavobacterium flevense TaxID=983 RepID=A0A4Y4AZN3_9FLAO|nr:biopolymer transporter ExbD [Flavobacterium flevense]GEC73576.1 biopolymer transporter ExbD [Flavobacterium flevense]SHL76008.1 outer membrane transport energization protein ExbD [Flavobacterium flevense]